MTRKRLNILLKKYHCGQCSEYELQELEAYYHSLGSDDAALPEPVAHKWEQFAEQEYELLQKRIAAERPQKRHSWLYRYKVAAILAIGLGIGTGIMYYYKLVFLSHVQLPAALSYNATGNTDAQSRYLELPDSSVVILHAGSTLKLYDSSFDGKTREVALKGTAYFAIHHMPEKPFVIHAGALKVTVLGTAFNIKESGDSVAVTVTRGKVKVEDEHKVIAILTPNQQITYTPQKQDAAQREVKADNNIKWIKAGLLFNDESMDNIARQLEARYDVHITFTNEQVMKCRVSVNNAFNGTESLDDILSFICPAVNASYKSVNGGIVIDGAGCSE